MASDLSDEEKLQRLGQFSFYMGFCTGALSGDGDIVTWLRDKGCPEGKIVKAYNALIELWPYIYK